MKQNNVSHYPGTLVAIEGIDGSGKSTLAKKLYTALSAEYNNICLTKEPGDSQLGQAIRAIVQDPTLSYCPQAEYLLFAADRAEHMTSKVIPLLKKGYLVLSDRMADSSVVYQGYAQGVDVDMITTINAWAMQGIRPDITLYVRVSAQTARDRISARNEAVTRFEARPLSFYQNLIDGFDTVARNSAHYHILDGEQESETIALQALQTIRSHISASTKAN